ncbi:MAG: nitroreductase family protein, partial [Gammaproteobacteria bacterium]
DLLWAAFGVNRPAAGGRTAPSAHNWQEITLYLAMADGLYRYDPHKNRLQPVLDRDIRALTGKQDFVASAPLDLILVADLNAMEGASAEDRQLYSAVDAGVIAQNVYLFCASAGLNVVVRGWIDRKALGEAMGLKAGQRIVVSQTVGYGANAERKAQNAE